MRREARNYNRRLRRAWKRYGYDGQPPTVSAAEIIRSSKDRDLDAQVRTADDLNKMIKQWNRFNEIKRPGSTKPHILETGEFVPEFFVQERKRWVREENKRRKAAFRDIYPDEAYPFETFSKDAIEMASKIANKNLHPLSFDEGFENPLDRLGKFGRYSESDRQYAVRYGDTIAELFPEDVDMLDISRILERFVDEDPMALREIFENPMYDDVTAINFVYESGSPFMSSFQNYEIKGNQYKGRRQQVIDFWNQMEEKYLE